jgi:hypothetical protein
LAVGLPPITGTNQVIPITVPLIGSITITLNGRHSAGTGDTTAFPLRVTTSLLGLSTTDILVARSHSDMNCSLAPSAAPVSLRGRVLGVNGRGVSRATVTIWDGLGFSRTVVTNSLGSYRINDIPAGGFYFVTTSAKGYRFTPQSLSLDDNLSGFDLFLESSKLDNVKSGGITRK